MEPGSSGDPVSDLELVLYIFRKKLEKTLRADAEGRGGVLPALLRPRFGDALRDILPVIEPGRSDSANFDNVLELLAMPGRSLPHALMILIPESWNEKNPIFNLKAFYECRAGLWTSLLRPMKKTKG
ncbi:MAG: hypothetical protein LBK74_09580 [Treponema sp.]|jgi:hypothetical protein|nr:hypothetical protein [Treponema sp.]